MNRQSIRRERGAALIVTLVLLVVLAMIGLSSMNTSIMEEKMAGNLRDQNLAFQSAETAVRAAEALLAGVSIDAVNGWNGSGGLYGLDTAEPVYANPSAWSASATATKPEGVASAPRYFIKHARTVTTPMSGSTKVINYGSGPGTVTTYVFRITARGTGGSDNAVSMIQSHFGRNF